MAELPDMLVMLQRVAMAMGESLLQEVVFTGGCITGLLLTDDFTREQVRHTDDVDLIVNTISYTEYHALQKQLQTQGFTLDALEDWPVCAMKLGDMRVDFMPIDDLLGFTNSWFQEAYQTAQNYPLTDTLTIRLVKPVYFVAMKLEAYKGRGLGDALASRDIEDLLHLVDGRVELVEEVKQAGAKVQTHIASELSALLTDSNFAYAVSSQAQGNREREAIIFDRLDALVALAGKV